MQQIHFFQKPSSLLFLGDYVNSGYSSIETITLLYLLKLQYPGNKNKVLEYFKKILSCNKDKITLLRGHYEHYLMCECYGLSTECQRKYKFHQEPLLSITKVFPILPIAATIDSKVTLSNIPSQLWMKHFFLTF